MNKYRIVKDEEPVASQMTAETDKRFALAEWLFEAEVEFDTGKYQEEGQGFSIEVHGHQYEIQTTAE